jgi:pimeloyl-ACP methyl ester carboxylesterase
MFPDYSGLTGSIAAVIDTGAYALARRCVWLPCNVTGYGSVFMNYSLDCCTLHVPLNYTQPNRSISISMSRLRSIRPPNISNTLFILMGGPGGSGWALLENAAQLIPADVGITIILPDHRGTGLSTVLGCDDKNAQNITADCIAYLTSKWGVEGLNQFSITAAAHDLSVQVQSYQADYSGRVSIFGVSYGTQWLDRFLQIYPTLVQSAVMDGVVNPIMASDSRNDLWSSIVAWQFLTYCQSQPECNQYFSDGESPQVMLYRILTELDSNEQQCIKKHFTNYQLTSDKIRGLFFGIIQPAERYMDRIVIPAVIFRLNRCNAEDVIVLNFFFQTTLVTTNQTRDIQNGPGFITSRVLNYNIVQSETWLAINESEVDKDILITWHRSTIMAPENPEKYILLRSQWPKYSLDQYRFQLAAYTPLLMISGQLDPATGFDQAAQLASITSKTRTFYAIPLAGHVTVNMAALGYDCSLKLICSWLFPDLFPVEWRDPKCIRDLPTTFDFVGATERGVQYSLKFFNISRPFGNEPFFTNSSSYRTEALRLSNLLYFFVLFLFSAFLTRMLQRRIFITLTIFG